MTMFTAVAIVREKERGNIELLINTPITTTQLMIGKVIPYIAIGLIQVALIVFLGKTLFHVPMRGHFLDLYLAATMFIAANLSIGLLISTAAKTQFQAMQLTIMLILPSILISGFLFPFEGMPLAAQYLGELLPNTHFTRLSRGIMLRGADISELHKDLATLAIFFVITMTLSVLRFSRRLD
jgi:ABC-2 type transport system permease protein